MAQYLFMLFIIMLTCEMALSETWVTIDNKLYRMRRMTNCARLAKGDQQKTCDCCLIKNSLVHRYDANNTLKSCANSNKCIFDASAFKKASIAQKEILRAKNHLKTMSIIDITDLKYTPAIPSDGVLTEKHVIKIIEALYDEHYLSLPKQLFSKKNEAGLIVKQLGDNAKGFYSGQLFSISYDPYYLNHVVKKPGKIKALYILKETKKAVKEVSHLFQINASQLLQEKVETQQQMLGSTVSDAMAKISFDDLHFKIKTRGKFRYFSLLQTAPGQSLHFYLQKFGEVASSTDLDDEEFLTAYKKTKYIFYRIGYAVSLFHQKYAQADEKEHFALKKTYTHGDMHAENIFYDAKNDIVTLIDNETFALSLDRPSCGVEDIVDLYMMHTIRTIAHKFSKQLTTNEEFGINDYIWHKLWGALIAGYFWAYGDLSKNEYLELVTSFRQEFFRGFSQLRIFRSLKNFSDQRKLKRFGPSLRRRHVKNVELTKVFDRLLAEGLAEYEDNL
jgi:hypothetical protein